MRDLIVRLVKEYQNQEWETLREAKYVTWNAKHQPLWWPASQRFSRPNKGQWQTKARCRLILRSYFRSMSRLTPAKQDKSPAKQYTPLAEQRTPAGTQDSPLAEKGTLVCDQQNTPPKQGSASPKHDSAGVEQDSPQWMRITLDDEATSSSPRLYDPSQNACASDDTTGISAQQAESEHVAPELSLDLTSPIPVVSYDLFVRSPESSREGDLYYTFGGRVTKRLRQRLRYLTGTKHSSEIEKAQKSPRK